MVCDNRHVDYFSDPKFVALFGLVVLARFLVPLTIFRWPLLGILTCLVLDAADQTVFQSFGFDPPFYQGYDKAMDVFYLGMAFIATMRNWTSISAIAVSRILFFYRQIGVVAFELSGIRTLLLIFPNTFEYFFIAVEAIRLRWKLTHLSLLGWIILAAFIWIFIKLPQEYWIHVAQLDFTDALANNSWFGPLVAVVIVAILSGLWWGVRPRLAPTDHSWQLVAPPLPEELNSAAKRAEWNAQHAKAWSYATLEKTLLVGLLLVVFGSIIPGVDFNTARIVIWTGVFVALNIIMELNLTYVRNTFSKEGMIGSLLLRFVINSVLLVVVNELFYESLRWHDILLFVLLFSTLVSAYDRYRPVYEFRLAQASRVTS